mgnify:CR=1 FL=1
MKLILYKHNLNGYGLPLHLSYLTIKNFPSYIQEAAKSAEVVEYHDGDNKVILKDKNTLKFNSPCEFAMFIINNAAKNGFYNWTYDIGRNGITKITLERH